MRRFLLSLLLVAATAGTAAADVTITFHTVDEVERDDFFRVNLRVRGIPQGQTAPVAFEAYVEPSDGAGRERTQSCERMALLAASRPGRYLLRLQSRGTSTDEHLVACRLIRR